MGVAQRTVQRSLKKLEKCGLIERAPFLTEDGKVFPAIRLDGLIAALEKLVRNDVALLPRMARGASVKPAALSSSDRAQQHLEIGSE
jgi:hypothetical protein